MSVIVSNKIGKVTSAIKAGEHEFVADETAEVGGSNKGPTPYDYLLSALGSCTAMTLRLYADRKGWDLQEVEVKLGHGKDYPTDCQECESESAKIDVIEKSIELKGNLDEKQKSRLMQIADKCPVHKTLVTDTEIRSTLL